MNLDITYEYGYKSSHRNFHLQLLVYSFRFQTCNRFSLSWTVSKVFMSSSFNWDLYGVHVTRAIKLSNSHHLFSKWIFRNFHRIFNKWLAEKKCVTTYWRQISKICPHTCKKREIVEIYLRNFFWIFRKILGWECEINTAPKPSPEVAPS